MDAIEQQINHLERGETTKQERNIFQALRVANTALKQLQELSTHHGEKILAATTRGEMFKLLIHG